MKFLAITLLTHIFLVGSLKAQASEVIRCQQILNTPEGQIRNKLEVVHVFQYLSTASSCKVIDGTCVDSYYSYSTVFKKAALTFSDNIIHFFPVNGLFIFHDEKEDIAFSFSAKDCTF